MALSDNIDEILNEIEQNKHKWDTGVEDPQETLKKAEQERRDKVESFHLQLNLDDDFGEYTASSPVSRDTQEVPSAPAAEPSVTPVQPAPSAEPEFFASPTDFSDTPTAPAKPYSAPTRAATPAGETQKKKRRTDWRSSDAYGCAGSLFYILLILGVSLVLACVVIVAALDITGLNKSGREVKITVEEGASTAQIADELVENGLIDNAWVFRLYAGLTGHGSEFQAGVYTLSGNMGCGNIVDQLRAGVPRTVVKVTIPEGYTVDQIAALMEENAVCTKKTFYEAVLHGDYSDYSFVAEIPAATGDYAGRGYALEGYLFPDTYEFYTGSSGDTVVRKLLDNFDNRVSATYRAKIAASGMTLNDAVILASIVQAEADNGEWARVSRVFINRLNAPDQFPRLESEATITYFKKLDRSVEGLTIAQDAYDTAVRRGLIPGAIGNAGLSALDAVLSPSTEQSVVNCYFFASDYNSGVTYYSKTYAEHDAVCRKYKIGIYAENS